MQRADCLFITCFQNGNFLPLVLKPLSYLHFRQLACVDNRSKIIVEECRYTFSKSPNPDDESKWIFRYEYSLKPEPNKIIPHAHLHLNAFRNDKTIKHMHFPTGRLSVEQIIAHLIVEHQIKPKMADWFKLLDDSHKGFTKRRNDLALALFP
ncbi:MAG: hypothetical protein NTZ04_01065 [Chloroflexi bacterium]|nr:hypothetical protein [Chloroflexota bacterium]